ncbi:hypothetical protein H920_17360 [Fukomys damarensis]|uniref:Uncharacterized protein n=1 Tax=Fukomys damarensis TaxID=885580 RepID=A0A091CSM4_FUKDA|nr:hypothetical protein H920_17360 [Fukomys damarensis]
MYKVDILMEVWDPGISHYPKDISEGGNLPNIKCRPENRWIGVGCENSTNKSSHGHWVGTEWEHPGIRLWVPRHVNL